MKLRQWLYEYIVTFLGLIVAAVVLTAFLLKNFSVEVLISAVLFVIGVFIVESLISRNRLDELSRFR